MKRLLIFILITSLLVTGCSKKEVEYQEQPKQQEEVTYTMPNAYDKRPTSDIRTNIKLSNKEIKVTGEGIELNNKKIMITKSGVYEFCGISTNTEIVIDTKDNNLVEIVLNKVEITNEDTTIIKSLNSKETLITLINTNKLTSKKETAIDSETILNIGGSGKLNITSSDKGIKSSKDIIIENSTINITSKEDSIKSDGSIYLLNGSYTLNSNRDAIQSEKALLINDGIYNIKTTTKEKNEDEESRKGFKAEQLIQIENGEFEFATIDDAINGKSDLIINNGIFKINTGDDGIHTDNNLTINNGNITINKCVEGIEGTIVEINGGTININSEDDSINAKAGTEEAKKSESKRGNELVKILINGGEITATAKGDALDSNGNVYLNGGTLKLHGPSGSMTEGAIMASGEVIFKGGNISLISLVGQKYYADSQPIIFISFIKEQKKGTKLILKDENKKVITEIKTKQNYFEATFTAPELKIGSTYSIYQDDKKLIDITINNVVSKRGADGKRYTGGYK